MTTIELNNRIKAHKEEEKLLNNLLDEYLNNKEISLKERYNTLVNSGLGSQDDRTDFDLGIDDNFLYESPLYLSKYEVINVDDILNALIKAKIVNDEMIDTFMNYCVEGGYSSMKFDW